MTGPRPIGVDGFEREPHVEIAPDDGAAWMRHMRRGEFEAAWRLSDADLRRARPADAFTRPRHQQRIWDGRPVDGRRVLVRCYHGLGDTIQFARFLPALAARADLVVVWAQPALLPLLETIDAPLDLRPLHDGVPDATFDVDVEIMELAWLLRVTTATLPGRTPYLRAGAVRRRDGDVFTVGAVWRGGGWDPARSTTAATLAPLADVPGVRLVAFDPVPTPEDREGWPGAWEPAATVTDLARAIAATDLLITVDTLAAHLAGALATPVWTLLAQDADWRWMLDRSDSPWYPTMRLYRQPAPDAWPAVIARVRAALWTAATWPALALRA
jgi:hypothetical protein